MGRYFGRYEFIIRNPKEMMLYFITQIYYLFIIKIED